MDRHIGWHVVRRLGETVVLAALSTLLVFAVVDLAPADPVVSRLGQIGGLGTEDLERIREELGLTGSVAERYASFLSDLVRGDLGLSVVSRQPVSALLREALPVTLQLTAMALSFAVGTALVLGVIASLYRGRWPDTLVRLISVGALAAPNFWIALLAINLFAVALGWFPTGGYAPLGEGVAAWFRSLLLPALAAGAPVAGILVRVVRASVADELERDYVRTAVGSGLPWTLVVGRNVLRNALVPPLTVLGLYVGYLLSGAVLVETVFALPGMGRLLVGAAMSGDLFVIRTVALLAVGLFLVTNLAVDLTYTILEKRIEVT